MIVPSYNRPERLETCLSALAKLDYPDFEVVIVDDGSSPPLRDVAEQYRDRLSLVYVYQENTGPARARNVGAKHATGDLLAFTDDDCAPHPDWLCALAREMFEMPDALVGGRTYNAVQDSLHSDVSQDLVSFLYDYALGPGGRFDFFTSNNMACRRAMFLALGGFDETFTLAAGEDRDFGLRVAGSGRPLRYVSDAVVAHHHVLTLKSFWRQQSNYGAGAHHLRERMREHGRHGLKFEGLRFYSAMLRFPFRHSRTQAFNRSALLLLSQVAMVTGYLASKFTKQHAPVRHPQIPAIPGAFRSDRHRRYETDGFLPEAMALADPAILPALRADAKLYLDAVARLNKAGKKRVPYFVTDAVRTVAFDPNILEIVKDLLEDDAWVMWGANIQENTPNAADDWHVDMESWFWPSITVVVGLGGCSPDNATRLIPGSHRLPFSPADLPDAVDDDAVLAAAQKGNLSNGPVRQIAQFGDGKFYVFNARTWHSGARIASQGRTALFLHYQRASAPRIPYMKDYSRHLFSRRAASYIDGSPQGAPNANKAVYRLIR